MAPRKSGDKRKHPPSTDSDSENEDNLQCDNGDDEEGCTRVEGILIPAPLKPANLAPLESKTRLIITKITNRFFKSYGDGVVLGPFTKCFNAIVGPNGSGKSNVIDSMLFVFGYRASKIRSKKISVLIHNSEKYPNLQSCTVSVHFCEIIDKAGIGYERVLNSEFVVSRTANKDNSSYYELNHNRVQFKEVGRLLKKHGVDLDHNRFLILQGEVEEIAMMKCKATNENETGMLEYLEDIIGTNQYKEALIQLTDKIEIYSEQRLEKLNRVKLIEKELNELRGPFEEAVAFLKLENEVMEGKNYLYQKDIFEFEIKLKENDTKKIEVQTTRNELIAKLTDIKAQIKEKESVLQQQSSEFESLQIGKDKLKESYNVASKKDVQLQADMEQLNNNRKKLKSQLVDEKKRLLKLEEIPVKNQSDIRDCEKREVELTEQIARLENDRKKALIELRGKTHNLQSDKERLETELGALVEGVNATERAVKVTEAQLKLFKAREETEQAKLETLKGSIQECKHALDETARKVSELKPKIPLTQKSLDGARDELRLVMAEEAQINADLRQKRFNLQDAKSSEEQSRSRGKVLDALMEQKRLGKCPGIYGRLGDLGGIDKKYDVAVSTACPQLENLAVDTVDTAQWCIEFLKQHNIGRATFIPLEKQEYLRGHLLADFHAPENVPRLFDLVQTEAIFQPAFYFVLRDTLVATDVEQATRVAYGPQRYRVVTLAGDMIEISGTMSGGGRSQSRGRMGSSKAARANTVDVQELERMTAEVLRYEERLRVLGDRQTSLENQISTLEPKLEEMKLQYERLSRDLKHLEVQHPDLVRQLKQQESVARNSKSDPEQVARLEALVKEKQKEHDRSSVTYNRLKGEVDEITEEINAKNAQLVKPVEKKLSEANKKLHKCTQDITRLKVAIQTSIRDAKKCTAQIQSLEKKITDAENGIRRMHAERNEIEVLARNLLEKIADITARMEEEGCGDLRGDIGKLNKQLNALELEKVDVDQNHKKIMEGFANWNANINSLKKKLSQLTLHVIPNEESSSEPQLKTFSMDDIKAMNAEQVQLNLQTAMKKLSVARPNLNIIEEYRKGKSLYIMRSRELDAITTRRNEVRNAHESVKQRRKEEFMAGYNVIRMKLKEMYQMITLGGDADFELVDSFDPFAEGVQFNVRPPKKSWKNISNLSGGEKTLSSLALVFALHYYKPSPLYVMDEIDAALDFKNVSIVGNYIKERTKDAQFIIISLRSDMFELCDNLVGIYKIENCTRTLTIDPNGFKKDEDVNGAGWQQAKEVPPIDEPETGTEME